MNRSPVKFRSPSVRKLAEVFADQAAEAKRILRLPKGELPALRESLGLHPAATRWQIRMEALNRLGDFSGVETLALSDGSFVDYLNAGDTYSATLLRWNGNYYVGDWGSLVERHNSMDFQEAIAANHYRQH